MAKQTPPSPPSLRRPQSATPPEGPFARLLREALGRLAAPELSQDLVQRSLEGVGLPAIPDDPHGFATFACGAFHDAVLDALGEQAAEAILMDLSPAFAIEDEERSSGVRRRQRHSLAPPTDDAPIVVIASHLPGDVDALVPRLRERAKVVAAYEIFGLLQAIERRRARPLTLILNDGLLAGHPSALGTLARLLPADAKVVLFGSPDQEVPSGTGHWLRLGTVEDLDAVVDVGLSLLPKPTMNERETMPPEPRPAPKILLAHDDPAWRARFASLLAKAGYETLSAPDGFMALERCIDELPDAVIAGYHMPTLDGVQLAALLDSRFNGAGPFVLLVAEGALPEPPFGTVAVVSRDSAEDVLTELATMIF